MKIAVACDHGGYSLKQAVKDALSAAEAEIIDLGTDGPASVDYPEFAQKAVRQLLDKTCDRIVLICGTGIGMSIFANRIPGIRGALCHDSYTARMSRLHNDSNCLILGARVTGPGIAGEIVETWIKTPFEGGRHAARLARIEELTKSLKD